jgi:hypothetical protein
MEVVNLKSAITFRVELLPEQIVAWSTKSFRGKRGGTGTKPEPKEHVVFDVHEIAIESRDCPWYRFMKPQRITVLWSNVLSVQYEEAQL